MTDLNMSDLDKKVDELSIEELEESDISGTADQLLKACKDRRPSRDRTVSAERGGSPYTIPPIRAAQIRPWRTLNPTPPDYPAFYPDGFWLGLQASHGVVPNDPGPSMRVLVGKHQEDGPTAVAMRDN